MALDLAEMRGALAGAWRIFKGDPQGLRAFDMSVGGFWGSFLLIVPLAVPAIIVAHGELALQRDEAAQFAMEVSEETFLTSRVLALALNWLALPLIMAVLARPLDFSRHYVAFVVTRNWCELLAILPFAAAALAYLIGLVNYQIYVFLMLIATGLALRLQYLVARLALGVGVSFALGVVVLDLVIGTLVVSQLVVYLVGVQPGP